MNYTKWRNLTLYAKMQTDKKYLIIKMGDFLISTAGLGWYIIYMLYGIRFAIENDFIPVVDWQNCKLPQYNAAKVGKENVWEYFFDQPCDITLEQAYESGDFFTIDDIRGFVGRKNIDFEKIEDFYSEDIMEWRNYFQKYIRLRKEVKEYFEQCKQQQNLNKEEYIGVLARGTDYLTLKPTGHFKAVPVDELFELIDQCKNQRKIFLATEDEQILKMFEDRYKEIVYSTDARRYKHLGHNTLNATYKEEDGFKRDLNYLYSLYMISTSSACIYSACGGAVLASLMRKEAGNFYKFVCCGYNKAKGIIVGSYLEKQQNRIAFVGDKPLMFYALNTLKLLNIEETDIIVSKEMKREYKDKIGLGEQFGMKINYIISDTYDITEYLMNISNIEKHSKVVLLYADYIIHGKDVIKDFSEKINTFDGAYIWGVKTFFSQGMKSVKIDKKKAIPEKILDSYQMGDYILIGRYVFDFDLKEVIKTLLRRKEVFKFTDILNEYMKRKKLFFLEYQRGIICLKIEDIESKNKADQLIKIIEEFQIQKIGDFEAFRK